MIPKSLRLRAYKILLSEIKERKTESPYYLCYKIRYIFPFLPIFFYKELWENREHTRLKSIEVFDSNEERIIYLNKVISILLNHKK